MSLIPLDEPRGDGPKTSREGPADPTIVQRFLAGVKTVLLSLPGGSILAGESAESESEARPAEPERASDQMAQATLPASSDTSGRVIEVVSTESGDTLTVEAVDNPDATISSDTWESVER
jgi:hypothetical protein